MNRNRFELFDRTWFIIYKEENLLENSKILLHIEKNV